MKCFCLLFRAKPIKVSQPPVYVQNGSGYQKIWDVSDGPNRITQFYAYEYLQRYAEAISRALKFFEAVALTFAGKRFMAKGRFGYYARMLRIPFGCIAHLQKCINYCGRYEGESDDGIQKPFKWFCPYFMGFDGASGLLMFGVELSGLRLSGEMFTGFKAMAHRVHWWGHLCAFSLMATGAATDFYTAATYQAWEPKSGEEWPEGFDAISNSARLTSKLAKRQCKGRRWAVSGIGHGLECAAEAVGSKSWHEALRLGARLVAFAKSSYEVYHHDISPACTA